MKSYSTITRDEERTGQFSRKTDAVEFAKMETMRTKRQHQVFLTTTYRNLIPRVCWTVCLQMGWKHGSLVTIG